ncbi:MAG: MazG nucleotide pyrophosphohydrolase domain-containing protein, partial [Geminicoccaceae bacterium]
GETSEVLAKIEEELDELKTEIDQGMPPDRIEDELGDLLFTVTNLARHLKVDPETALRSTNRKFERRFRDVEQALRRDGKIMTDTPLDDLDALWEAAKKAERS